MPFQIIYKDNFFRLQKPDGTFAKSKFKTKQSAINQGLNWMKYRKEKGIVKGNKIIIKK